VTKKKGGEEKRDEISEILDKVWGAFIGGNRHLRGAVDTGPIKQEFTGWAEPFRRGWGMEESEAPIIKQERAGGGVVCCLLRRLQETVCLGARGSRDLDSWLE